ncbi:MAG TPA: VWA domain-containing protein [Vicinamibacteria bacterium]|nr:VWA domain-containing protein [Vicinamibacteria bacterium]
MASLRRVLAVATPLAFALARGGAEQAVRKPVFPSETRLVVLQATVKNGRGELVTNLGREAFTLYEDGKAQPISVFRADDVPVSLGLLIDNSGSMRRLRAKVEEAALACVRASNHDDEVFVLNFADKARIDVPLTTDIAEIERGIARVDSIGGTALRDALDLGTRYLAENGSRQRKALLVISDGKDNASTTSVDQIRREAEKLDIVVYAVGLASDEDGSISRYGRHELDDLAELTGGVAYYPRSFEELDAIALGIARQIRSQYTIGYRPADRSLDGSYRKLRVVARSPERLTVRTRAGFRGTPVPGRRPSPPTM